MAPSWVISKTRNVVAKLVPDPAAKRYEIEIHTGVSAAEMAEAEKGTVRDGRLVHPMNPERSGVEIKTIRGDYRDANGVNRNRLRLWEKSDFIPRPDDIFQERLYCIQWITQGDARQGTAGDIFRRRHRGRSCSRAKGRSNRARKPRALAGRGPCARHEDRAGGEDDAPIRERGWTHWHHLFGARQLFIGSSAVLTCGSARRRVHLISAKSLISIRNFATLFETVRTPGRETVTLDHVFINQALNTLFNYGIDASHSWRINSASRGHACSAKSRNFSSAQIRV